MTVRMEDLPEREAPKSSGTLSLKEKLMRIQYELKAPKNLRNNFGGYNYRNAESILEALKPLLVKYGATVTITDEIVEIGGHIYVKATACIYGDDNSAPIGVEAYAREAESKKGMDEAQITGATSSYARKYALNGLFLLDDTQDVDTEAYQKAEKTAQNGSTPKNNKTTPKPKAKPTEAPQSVPQATATAGATPAAKDDTARVELKKFLAEHDIDSSVIIQACEIGPASTHEDYVEALNYAKTIARLTGPDS